MVSSGLMRVSPRAKQPVLEPAPFSLARAALFPFATFPFAVAALFASVASARPMDPALARLVVDLGCAMNASAACVPDRTSYIKLVNQLGGALAPHAAHGARTTGLAGFDVSLLAALTSIDSGA